MKQYKTVNNLVGWITFLIAATVYCMTIEPTASFWDCPEFITTGYKLEVGHPPGAPFFMLVANLFSQFASDASTVAKMVNYMSALMSGACILFLFWSITHLVRKLVVTDENNITRGQMVTIMGSGLVGALAYTFSDTFWFSAVEGEVYAFSSLFTAVVFWLILKWEDVANEPHSDRWLILIAYLTGLSIGVHLLNLLCLPAIVLVYYYKKVPNANARGSLLALLASGILVAAVLYGIVPGIVKVGGWFELLFVNTLGMSFNTGVIVYIILLAACLIWGIYESYTERNKARMALSFILTIAMLGIPFYGHGTSSVVIGVIVIAALWLYLRPKTQAAVKEKFRVSARTLNTSLLCTMMIVIGYSSYALIVIRSTANTPMDQNSPEDIFTLGEYLGREQYGTRPLFYGPAFSSQVALDVKDGYCEPRIKYNGTKFIRTRYQLGSYRCHCHCRIVALPPSEDAGSRQREIPRIGTHAEHLAALHHDDCHRIFLVCTYRHPLHRQHADGPELSGRHLHTGRIPGTRAVWHTPAVLWPCLLLASGTGRERRLLRTAHQVQRHEVHPQGESYARRKGFVHRNPRTH